MVQFDRVVLVVEDGDRTGVFELRNSLSPSEEGRRNFILGGRGGAINELLAALDEDDELNSRESFFLDGGTGTKEKTFTCRLIGGDGDHEPLQMGDGSSDPNDPDDVTEWDATGAGHPMTQWQILDHWLSEARTDSENPAELHWGEWSDGSYVDEGVYGEPIDVVVQEWPVRRGEDEPSDAEVTITAQSASAFEEAAEAIEDEGR
jgi:hypothetical protein